LKYLNKTIYSGPFSFDKRRDLGMSKYVVFMIKIEKMTPADIDAVLKLEKACFGDKWTSTPFASELERPDCSYFVVREGSNVIGYSGCWLILEELHITIMAVHPEQRRKKIGQRLLIKLLQEGNSNGAKWATLEVKASNIEAQRLYEKFGFTVKGRRKQYYQQDREDALIMWTEEIESPDYRQRMDIIENELLKI
jgi:ribosomal-protein-alanine N-acetyltransferase